MSSLNFTGCSDLGGWISVGELDVGSLEEALGKGEGDVRSAPFLAPNHNHRD